MASWHDVRRIALALPETDESVVHEHASVAGPEQGLCVGAAPAPRGSGGELEEVIVEAWLTRAPKRMAKDYMETRCPPDGE